MADRPKCIFWLLLPMVLATGCATDRPTRQSATVRPPAAPQATQARSMSAVVPASFQDNPALEESIQSEVVPAPVALSSLAELEGIALYRNPAINRLYREYQAAAARSQYVGKLPDPRVGANFFGDPIETASGSQRASMNVSQMLPWLKKLDAEEQRASFEALAIRAEYEAERLKVLAGVRSAWYRLYVIDRQIHIAEENQRLLESLIELANARIETGAASQGDVLLGTLELSQLEERLLVYYRQRTAIEAELNRLAARPADTPVIVPAELAAELPPLSAAELLQIALGNQPEIEAIRLRMQASLWGVEVARFSRRPELTLSASYFFTDDNRPPSAIVDVGEDPWALGVQLSLPLGREKYDAIRNEANWKHRATRDSLEAAYQRYDAMVLELIAEARRAAETATLYRETILPQARQTLAADQEGYSTGKIEFDRVIRDYRSLLTLELGYHQAVGDLSIAIARLQQAAGDDVLPLPQAAVPE